MLDKDFLIAHCIRFGKDYHEFTKEEWTEVINISGMKKVLANAGSCTCCARHGLLT